ncbi:MAG: polymer-forming cytoskeletal protein [Paludibacteraceae bacterium]|jgi:cytoskeletal protein CcmA (bactofilin family)|nr:polymer-forming cytoskeletal protein [Paludibacteraceae bacterium]
MGLFGSDNNMSKEVTSQGAEYNTLAYGTKVTGEINAENNFRLDGSVEGTITCKGKVIIGAKGVMQGTLTCANAEILGTLNGKVLVSDTLLLKSTAKVEGEIKTKILSIEPNAKFTGTCDMTEQKGAPVEQHKK